MKTRSVPELEAREDVNADVNNKEVQNNESQNKALDIEQRDRFSAEKPSHEAASQNARLQGVYSTPDRQNNAVSDVPGAFPQEIILPPTLLDKQASPIPS
jgi:hypothetical protein